MISTTRWRKSHRSNTDSACVELNDRLDAVRDSKNPTGAVLPVAQLSMFLESIRLGQFDR
ncbi:MAG TPA: DUF397 domain-containing protein [Pseudonocardiaceae bacterium]|jgi:hypothetical protein|nr:DUF397 domain-containing protein [Pseudonocardiaceae bacterium]